MLTLADDPNLDGGGPPADCSPRRKREKAIDAAAAAAAAEFQRMGNEAGEDGINERERGAYLFLNPDGSVSIGPISVGDPFVNGGSAQRANFCSAAGVQGRSSDLYTLTL